MCPDPHYPAHPRLAQLALDRLHEIAVQSERLQTLAEETAGKGHAGKLSPADADDAVKRLLGMSRSLVAIAERLRAEVADAEQR